MPAYRSCGRRAATPCIWMRHGSPRTSRRQSYPGVAITVDLYRAGGVRGVEIGSLMLGWKDRETGQEMPAARELVRLAIPRRVYTQSHIDYVVEVVTHVHRHSEDLGAYRIVEQAPFLRHFTARLEPATAG